MGADGTAMPPRFLYRTTIHSWVAVGDCGSDGEPICAWCCCIYFDLPYVAAEPRVDGRSLGIARRNCSAKMVAGAVPGCPPLRGMAGKFFLKPNHMGGPGISPEREWRNDGDRSDGKREKRTKADAGGLTEPRKASNLS